MEHVLGVSANRAVMLISVAEDGSVHAPSLHSFATVTVQYKWH